MDYRSLVALLQLLHAPGLGAKTLDYIIEATAKAGIDLADFVALTPQDKAALVRLKPNSDELIAQGLEEARLVADKLREQSIEVVLRGQEGYPEHLIRVLKSTAPPVLFVKGDLTLLKRSAVGFCGSRKASEKGLQIAAQCADALAQQDVNVISGYAHGVDLAAHRGALAAGGVTTLVLAEGILHFRPKREIGELLNDRNFLVVSEFSPRLPWVARNAMQRNRTICGFSDAMIVIESGMQGGTFEAGNTAIDLRLPLFAVDYREPPESAEGNAYFLKRGAYALKSQPDGKPSLHSLWRVLGIPNGDPPPNGNGDKLTPPLLSAPVETPIQTALPLTNQSTPRNTVTGYPKRLIEVDLPIKQISAHARREKSIRHGHISTLHIWWARRPLAACRAVLCAALWIDPADPACPPAFRRAAYEHLRAFAEKVASTQPIKKLVENVTPMLYGHCAQIYGREYDLSDSSADLVTLRRMLLAFIADFANWDNSTQPDFLATARALTSAAHEALGGEPGSRPLVVDPFAGGGAIPLEALRVGADAFASDLNPVAVLLNKVVLEYIPRYGQQLADEVRKWGAWIKEQAEAELAEFYPKDPDGATPIAYLWARTITCEGPGCGCEVPLMRSFWLAKNTKKSFAVKLIPNPTYKRVDFEIVHNPKASEVGEGTIKRGSAVCPCCGYTTPVERVRVQLKARRGGAADARLYAVVTTRGDAQGRFFRSATEQDTLTVRRAIDELETRKLGHTKSLSLIPEEQLPVQGTLGFRVQLYGMEQWHHLFTPRQLLALTTLARLTQEVGDGLATNNDSGLAVAVQTCLALSVNRVVDRSSASCTYDANPKMSGINHTFARQALPIVWDFAEGVPINDRSGGWSQSLDWLVLTVERESIIASSGVATNATATSHPLADDSVQALFTDPPYYDAVPYASLSDFFVVWLKRSLGSKQRDLFTTELAPKDEECIVDVVNGKDKAYFERNMMQAMSEARRILAPIGVGVVVFAHKSTSGWETQLQAMLDAGWTVTGSWPIDTEMGTRLRAMNSAALASSIHLVCRPREDEYGTPTQTVGDWREVLAELPGRIRSWLPRLEREGVVGADAIFACLGPAMEIYSRYARVEKASGEVVTLREYLEQVWAAVSREALQIVFQGADTTGFEEDARLSAMWLWTLQAGEVDGSTGDSGEDTDADDEGDDAPGGKALSGFVLEYDAARKIAQGIGAYLEKLDHLAEIKGNKARLRPVAERASYLFGKDAGNVPSQPKKSVRQMSLFEVLDEAEASEWRFDERESEYSAGKTTLDRLHQAMILHATGRTEALKRFLVEEGYGSDTRFWRLADALLRLYPKSTEEYRWLDGLLARKKGLGF
ncbi:MAG: DNA-processing protein DprA [Chloroflexi bacterium]|nr:DNA-processing protein DprA [Chloroflexota bacterium]